MLQGKVLKNVFNFKYLGFNLQADGERAQAMRVRMAIAGAKFGECKKVWKATQISLQDKIRLFDSGVVSVLIYGCEVWLLDEACQASLRGWCALLMSKVTGRSIREECVGPTYKIVDKVRARRLRFLGHALRSPESSLVRRVIVGQCAKGDYQKGSVLMDAPRCASVGDLITMAEDRESWRLLVNSITYDAANNNDDDSW